MRLRIALFLSAGMLVVSAGVANAATLEVPGDFDTIQGAVDVADPGDKIEIEARKKPYEENVTVGTDNLTITGVGGLPVIDAFEPLMLGLPAFAINASSVSIRKLEIHHGGGVNCIGDNCELASARFVGRNVDDCFSANGDNAIARKNRFVGCNSSAVNVTGEDATITGNKADRTNSSCYDVVGDALLFRDNEASRCEDGSGLNYAGNGARIEDSTVHQTDSESFELNGDDLNVINNKASETDDLCFTFGGDDALFEGNNGSDCTDGSEFAGDDIEVRDNKFAHVGDAFCISITGNEPVVADNRLNLCSDGIETSGENPRVIGNEVKRFHEGDGISVFCEAIVSGADACEDTLIQGNELLSGAEDDEGLDIDGDPGLSGIVVRNNLVRGSQGDGFELDFDFGLIEKNEARDGGAENEPGFEIEGVGNEIVENQSSGNGGSGFEIEGSANVIGENVATKNALDGILLESGSTATLLTENVAKKNLADGIENDGTSTDVTGNVSKQNSQVDCANDGTTDLNQNNECGDGSDFSQPSSGLGTRRRP